MELKKSLDGKWELYYYDASDGKNKTLADIESGELKPITATVPGNVEFDLAEVDLLPKDMFKGTNTALAFQYEKYDWWFKKEFEAVELNEGEKAILRFEGVDTIADYYLNGQLVSSSKNFYIPHDIDITDKMQDKNVLYVHIHSSVLESFKFDVPFYQQINTGVNGVSAGQTYLRKPPHTFGWDIYPRTVSAGLFKSVSIFIKKPIELLECAYSTRSYWWNNWTPMLYMTYKLNAPDNILLSDRLSIRVTGKCGEDSTITALGRPMRTNCGNIYCEVKNLKRWWPKGYGEPNIYDTTVELLLDGEVVDSMDLNVGIRTVELKLTPSLHEEDADFRFIINGQEIMCHGINWIPLSAYHSLISERYDAALDLLNQSNSNIVRVWGGGIYEDKRFYDYCDRHGIMVWQDVMIACNVVPFCDKDFIENFKNELAYSVRRIRNHASIILWSGDNEIDMMMSGRGYDPEVNKISREIIPEVLSLNDVGRPYLPSSPIVSSRCIKEMKDDPNGTLTENHLYAMGRYHKIDFFKYTSALFVSEIGRLCYPAISSMKKMFTKENLWPYKDNKEHGFHSADWFNMVGRAPEIPKEIECMFGYVPEDMEDFVLASQISHGEGDKFFVERMRSQKPKKTGIMIWNLIDAWPQISDALVDYYYTKKLGFEFFRRSCEPVCLMYAEQTTSFATLKVVNDTLKDIKGTFTVTDLDTDKVIHRGGFGCKANSINNVCNTQLSWFDQKMLLIEWEIDGKKYRNHYLTGNSAANLDKYREWLPKIVPEYDLNDCSIKE